MLFGMGRPMAQLRTVLTVAAALVLVVVLTRILQTDVHLRWGDAPAAQRPGVGIELLGRAPEAVRRASRSYNRTVTAAWAACGIAFVGHAIACFVRREPVVTRRSVGLLATAAFLVALTATWSTATLG